MKFIKNIAAVALALISVASYAQDKPLPGGTAERAYLVSALTKIADPVLNALSKNQLKVTMPVEAKVPKDRAYSTHLEAFGRLYAGLAPWLELGPDNTAEGKLRQKYIALTITCIHNATDPKAADFMNFNQGHQPLVDAAFFAQGLLRSPHQIWDKLDAETKINVLAALKSSRTILPSYTNWLLFSGTIEAALQKFDKSGDKMRMDFAKRSNLTVWYKGDGAYGDGANFHWDYYNSFVIQPMLVGMMKVWSDDEANQKKDYDVALGHIKRYAAVQERMISPEGTYPIIGRSLAYRFGAFQALSMVAMMHELSDEIKPQQVRSALYTMIKRQVEAPNTFDKNGWLQIGIYGHQPEIGENYISTGSLYLCSEGFLILGLPATDPLWQGRDEDWTTRKVWKGEDIHIDHAID